MGNTEPVNLKNPNDSRSDGLGAKPAGASKSSDGRHNPRGRRKKFMAVVVVSAVIAVVAILGYLSYPRTVHFYALNDYSSPINVRVDVDGARTIDFVVPTGSNGIIGMVVKSVQLGGGIHGLKCSTSDFNVKGEFSFGVYQETYVLLNFQKSGITIEIQDHAPLFL